MKFTIGTESILIIGKGTQFINLHKHAKKMLKELNAQHVVFGTNRDKKGHLRTFFIPMTDNELDQHISMTKNYINAVHA